MGAGTFALVEVLDFPGIAHRKIRRLTERPSQIFGPLLGVTPTLALAMAHTKLRFKK
jgi:hypothetical protein